MSYAALSFSILESSLFSNLPLGPTMVIGAFVLVGLFLYVRAVKKPIPAMSESVQTVGSGREATVPAMTIAPANAEGFSEELVAAITAAIAASLKTSTSSIVIRNIKPVAQNTPIWGMMGRTEQVNSRF